MPDPAAAVLAIPELLEAILLHLPPRDLLLAQRVDKSFFNAIQASKHIQQKLFFIAPPILDDEPTLVNPFLGRVASICSGDILPWFQLDWRSTDGQYFHEQEISREIGDIRALPFEYEDIETMIITTTSKPVKSDVLQQSSFRKMLIANEARKFLIGSICDTHMHYHLVTTKSMTEVMDMLDQKWVQEMCPNDPNKA